MKILRLLFGIPLLAFGGCFSPSIYVLSKTDMNYPIDKMSKIVIFCPEAESAEVIAFHSALRSEMKDLNFQLESFEDADYFLFARIEEQIEGIRSKPPMPTYPYSDVPIGNWSVPETANLEKALPYVKRYKVLIIHLSLCDLQTYRTQGKIVPVWEGTIRAEETNYQKNQEACIQKLLNYFGTDFEGYVRIE